jgi:flagellar L-ring protein precursor FlgH
MQMGLVIEDHRMNAAFESRLRAIPDSFKTGRRRFAIGVVISVLVWMTIFGGVAAAAMNLPGKKKSDPTAEKAKSTPPEEALKAYIQRVRAQHDTEVRTPGSIWVDQGRLVRLSTDAKAARLHDVVSIVVSESLAASTDGQVKNSRASNASSGFTGLFGNLGATNRLQNLLGQNAASGLTAQGQSVTNSSLATTFGGEVVDVLPNGMLVVQATRQLTFSQQTQLIKLRGLVRPEDVSAQNQVLSTAMTDLELEVTGKGIVNDYTYRQNPIWRFLQRLLVF